MMVELRLCPHSLLFLAALFAAILPDGGGKATFGHDFPRFQKNYWYEYSTPRSTSYPADFIDYHLSGEDPSAPPSTPIPLPSGPRFVEGGDDGDRGAQNNVTAQLGATATLSCLVANLQDKTVSWIRRRDRDPAGPMTSGSTSTSPLPELLTFGTSVYVQDARISVAKAKNRAADAQQRSYRGHRNSNSNNQHLSHNHRSRHRGFDWSLTILNAQESDEGSYECHVSTEPPLVKRMFLFVEAPVLTVMDGFGRELLDQYYKVGSSLEVMCTVDRLPARPIPEIIEWRHGNRKLAHKNATVGQSIRTDLEGAGAISHLAITQAQVRHSGVYTCSVSDTISQSLRLHIIDESSAKPIINNGAATTTRTTIRSRWWPPLLTAATFALWRLQR